MLKLICVLTYICGFLELSAQPHTNPSLFIGAVQFPRDINQMPDVRIYCSGHRIQPERNEKAKKIVFNIPSDRYCTKFSFLITPNISFETQENTVQYLKIAQGQSYKCYDVVLQKKTIPNAEGRKSVMPQSAYSWDIQERRLSFFSGRIPDDAIIICYNPEFVQELDGGDALNFPSIVIKPDIVTLLGSEESLHEKSAEMILSSINYNTVHTDIHQEVRRDDQLKTILTITT